MRKKRLCIDVFVDGEVEDFEVRERLEDGLELRIRDEGAVPEG